MTQNTEQNVRTREDREQEIAIMLCKARGRDPFQMTYQTIEPGVMEPYGDAWCHYIPEAKAVLEWHEAEARGRAEERAKSIGYLFDNPDTGTEYLPYHPIESGECQYAENIREATSAELLSVLIASWQGWKEDRDEKEKVSANTAALEARVKVLEAVLDGIKTYSGDTLTGPVGGSGDLSWYRDGVEEAFRRARAALTREGGV